MPKIISYTPAWLSRPSPGFNLFSVDSKKLSVGADKHSDRNSRNGTGKKENWLGPRRVLARRGTELFVVVGNTIRWANLCALKGEWEAQEQDERRVVRSIESTGQQDGIGLKLSSYRVLKVPVNEQIRQLVPSPNRELLAILTSHTIHVAILPDASHLDQPDTGPIRLKTHTLGPTTHVLSQSPIVGALWHPLGVNGECIVTVTKEAVVRVWEMNRENRWSFDSPALAIDLKKLHHGTSAEDDFSAAKIGTNKGFSLDALDMEVAAACFGGTGSVTESGWCPMTLWVAMAEGDVYALCPLLPSKWQPSSSLVPSLTTAVAAEKAYLEQETASAEEQRQCDEKYQWLAEIDRQDPVLVMGDYETSSAEPVYDRPSQPGPIPKLQGPFRILPGDIEDDLELSDIYVIASRLDMQEFLDPEGDDEDIFDEDSKGLSSSVVCLLTRTGRVYICLDLDGVEAQWLPSKKSKQRSPSEPGPESELVLLEALDTMDPQSASDNEWPTFTPDVILNSSFLVTHSAGISFLSLDPWLESLESELRSTATEGAEFRLGVFAQSFSTLRERILTLRNCSDEEDTEPYAAPIILLDSRLGYFLLTADENQPQAVILDSPYNPFTPEPDRYSSHDYEPEMKLLTLGPTRSVYQPPESLWAESSLKAFLDNHVHSRHKKILKEEIRLSSAILDLMTEAHRILSQETHHLGVAAADLFRRCQRLQEEFRDQIRRANEGARRIESLNGEDADDYDDEKGRGAKRIEKRLQAVRDRREELANRHEALRKRLTRFGGRDLSDKERAWVAEVKKLEGELLEDEEGNDEGQERKRELLERHAEARALTAEFISQAKELAESSGGATNSNGAFKVPPDIRKSKMADLTSLLDRQSALVNAARERQERLEMAAMT
ncbi:hypothetical protein MMC30_003336 [Trapelia coarctata]|nr:hypothetical protein [Trapelia coarctata]